MYDKAMTNDGGEWVDCVLEYFLYILANVRLFLFWTGKKSVNCVQILPKFLVENSKVRLFIFLHISGQLIFSLKLFQNKS